VTLASGASPIRFRTPLCLALLFLAGCQPGSNTSTSSDGLTDDEGKARIQHYVTTQHIGKDAVRLLPPAFDWSFLRFAEVSHSAGTTNSATSGSVRPMAIARGNIPAGWRSCLKAALYSVLVPTSDTCPGDWIAYRGDSASSGTSTLRLDWSGTPVPVGSSALTVQQPVDPMRIFARRDPKYGDRLYANNGTSIDAFDRTGRRLWSTHGLGIGEIVDVTDLDGDGEEEIIFSPGSRWNTPNPSGGGPGELLILATKDGEVLWRYAFTGIEFGLNRRRTTVAPNPQGSGKSIYAVMTYSPYLWRFDFSAGVRNGILLWKSPAMAYDSPDKPPLVADFDGDGSPEVITDAMGTLYSFRASDGALLDSLQYAPFHSFRGFATPIDLDGDGVPEIVGMSNTIYMKDVFVAHYMAGTFSVSWRKEWEWGLETTKYELFAMHGVIRPPGGSRSFLLWSVRDLRGANAHHVLELTDAVTGEVIERVDGVAYLDLLRASDGTYQVVTVGTDNSVRLIALGPNGFGQTQAVAAARWDGVTRLGRPAYVDDTTTASSTALILDANGAHGLLTLTAGGGFSTRPLSSAPGLLPAPLYAFEDIPAFVAADDASQLNRVDLEGASAKWANFAPKVFATPVTADVDGDGYRELVLPHLRGSAIGHLSRPTTLRIDPLVTVAPDQLRESFHVPVVVQTAQTGERLWVGYELHPSPLGDYIKIVAFDSDRTPRWSWQLPQTNWEPSLVVGHNQDGSESLFYNDSRMTAAFQPASGALLWTSATLGECQRQIASIDWNGDGIADVAVQSADVIAVSDGVTGRAMLTTTAHASYGGYIAATSDIGATKSPTLAVHAVGGMTLVDARRGTIYDTALDDRKVESIPPVIGRVTRDVNGLFQISGSGHLRRLSLDGSLLSETNLDVGVLTMTGAYVDRDDAVDLLVSTYRGELIAVSGADLHEVWRVQLDGSPGPAVATDIDGDGRGEIVVISGAGTLYVLQAAF